MALEEEIEKKYNLITCRLDEVLGGDIIKGILAEGRLPKAYWRLISHAAHIGYYVPLTKIADVFFCEKNFDLYARSEETHAFLDNLKAPLHLVTHRTKYYEFVLRAIFTSLGIPTSKPMFVRGSDYQLSREYNLDNYKLCTLATEHDARSKCKERGQEEEEEEGKLTFPQEKVYHPPPPGKGKNAKPAPAPVDGVAADETRVSDPPASQPDGEAVPA
ncbi:hypothetical protein L210DRAFT_3500207 [Boletus edulis BED1]|uniref:Uncharacterized protein n=1 Tax=Boletus edulis BED1 TaxID=1328754 RepID=A0AAD4C8N1_BOLED|nr:hypothetical protein L210DRAFT_3500207 [Boletus edulis BED1]